MDEDELIHKIIRFINKLLSEEGRAELSGLRYKFVQGAWRGQTYKEMSDDAESSLGGMQNAGCEVCRFLTEKLGIRVTISNFRDVIQASYEQSQTLPTLADVPTSVRDVNPFIYGPPVAPKGFYKQRSIINDIKNRIGAVSPGAINIVGVRLSGKTSLLHYIEEQTHVFCPSEQNPLIVLLNLQFARFHTPAGVIEGLRQGITEKREREPWSFEANSNSDQVDNALEQLHDQGHRLIVMFDKFESISRRDEVLQDWGECVRSKSSVGLFTIVIASERPVDRIYEALDKTSPFDNTFSIAPLGALEEDVWHQLVHDGFARSAPRPQPSLEFIDELAGGLPFDTQMVAALLWQHQNNEQLVREEFSFQATRHFHNLWRNLTVPEREVIRNAANGSVSVPTTGVPLYLKKLGLLRANGSLFSSVFHEFVRSQQ